MNVRDGSDSIACWLHALGERLARGGKTLRLVLVVALTGRVFGFGGVMALSLPADNRMSSESRIAACMDAPAMDACAVDCDANAEVTIEELVAGVAIALGLQPVARCPHADVDADGQVSVEELVRGVRMGLEGCTRKGGALYEFRACGQPFRVWMIDPAVIAEAERMLRGTEPQRIITGELRCGNGNFNGPWHWHLDAGSIAFAEVTIELCDGCPDFVDAELAYWLETVKRYCPWSAELVRRVW